MTSITLTFRERSNVFLHQRGAAVLIFEKPWLAFIAFIAGLPCSPERRRLQRQMHRKDRGVEAFLMFSGQRRFTDKNPKNWRIKSVP